MWGMDDRAGAYGEMQSRQRGTGCSVLTLDQGRSQVLQVLWSFSCLQKFRGKLYMPNNVSFLFKDYWVASDGCCWEVYVCL